MTASSTATLAAADRHCRAITRSHATTFALATRLLPAARRRDVHALYALARTADDLVDEPVAGSDPAAELGRFADRFASMVASADPRCEPAGADLAGADLAGAGLAGADLVLVAASATVRRHEIPLDCFDRFFASMRLDLSVDQYESWDELVEYMDGSAAAIGEMLLPLLDPVDRAAALGPARALGFAFQFTNFLRDVGEDLDRGRQYLPQDDLRRFGVDLAERRVDESFRRMMKFEIARCRRLYDDARPGLDLLSARSRPAITAAHQMYGAILDRIEANGYDVFTTRARVRRHHRMMIVAGSVRSVVGRSRGGAQRR